MATKETYGVQGAVDENGDLNIHYPITKAELVSYDNRDSGLAARDSQAAIDELNTKKTAGPSASTADGLAAFGDATGKVLKKTSAKGSGTKGIYLDANGVPQEMTYEVNKTVPADAKFTDTTYNAATQSTAGLMSAADKQKLDGISGGVKVYRYTFTAANWSNGKITIPAATHGITGSAVIAQFQSLSNGSYIQSWASMASSAEINASTHVITLSLADTGDAYAGAVTLIG